MSSSAIAVVNQFYEVSLKQKDAEGIRPLLVDDFRFVGPRDQRSGADEFVELNICSRLRRVKFVPWVSRQPVCSPRIQEHDNGLR
ncbi:MAG: hypothetical protein IPM53_05810 [Anaerolineaceae bacterium]|nr:hypothetical protein [Anaerolineaceae bacterium]